MQFPLPKNQTVFITGASRGIGLALTKQYLQEGCKVIATCRKPELASELLGLKAYYGDELIIEKLDVTEEDHFKSLVLKYTHQRFDILINNAGIYPENHSRQGIAATPAAFILDGFKTNALGAFLTIKNFVTNLQLAGKPKIINLSSQMGALSSAGGFGYSYRMSKVALNMLTKCVATEYPDIITISLRPGWVKTAMGGYGANLELEVVIPQITKLINELSQEQSGQFIDYQGKVNEW